MEVYPDGNQPNNAPKKKKGEPKMENLNALADFPFDFVGPDNSIPKWSVQFHFLKISLITPKIFVEIFNFWVINSQIIKNENF